MAKRNKQIDKMALEMRYAESSCLIKEIDCFEDLEQTDYYGRTLLINASFYGREDIVAHLISREANVNAADRNGYTSLHAAVQGNYTNIIMLLLTNGADINAKDAFGRTPIFIPGHTQPKELFCLLLDYGADPYIKNNYDISAYDRMAAYPEILELFEHYKK